MLRSRTPTIRPCFTRALRDRGKSIASVTVHRRSGRAWAGPGWAGSIIGYLQFIVSTLRVQSDMIVPNHTLHRCSILYSAEPEMRHRRGENSQSHTDKYAGPICHKCVYLFRRVWGYGFEKHMRPHPKLIWPGDFLWGGRPSGGF